MPLLREMPKNPRVIGVKNSSMPVQDIQMWHDEGAIVFNGPDKQLLSGLAAGAIGGIGGTYAAMPELYNAIYRLYHVGEMERGRRIQNECCRIIYKVCEAKGNMYALLKEVIRRRGRPGPAAGHGPGGRAHRRSGRQDRRCHRPVLLRRRKKKNGPGTAGLRAAVCEKRRARTDDCKIMFVLL